MQLRVDVPVPSGGSIEIMNGGIIIRATVRHCKEENGTYIVGIHILEYVTPMGDLIAEKRPR